MFEISQESVKSLDNKSHFPSWFRYTENHPTFWPGAQKFD